MKIVCHANECSFNKEDLCLGNVARISLHDGVAVCGNYNPVNVNDVKKLELIEGMYQVLVDLLLKDHGDEMDEDIRGYDLYTSADGNVFMTADNFENLQGICSGNECVLAMVDAINVLKYGRVLTVTECDE